MFGKSSTKGYTNKSPEGTNFLRNTVRARLFAGDSVLEDVLTKYQLYWKFYNNNHWASNNDDLLSFNYVRAIIDKITKFLIGKDGFEINVLDTYGDELPDNIEKSLESLLVYNWLKNKKKVCLHKMFQMGGVSGDVYVFLFPEKDYVSYTILDSRNTYPIFDGGDYTKVKGYRVIKLLGDNEKKYIQKVTEYTKGNMKTFFLRETGKEAEKFDVENYPNDYDFIPIVHIQNVVMSDNYFGKSDMEDILKINKMFNELSEDVNEIIKYHAFPTTVITGGTMGQLKKGIDQVWSGLPADANVFNLALGDDLSASLNFLKFLKDAMHDLSGVPEEVLSKVQHISNTSAAALQMLYQPIIQVADNKCVSYSEGIVDIHKMTLKIYQKSDLKSHPLVERLPETLKDEQKLSYIFDRYICEPVWKYNLPSDRMSTLQEANLELNMKVGSRREIMERLGKRNIPLIVSQIEEDTAVDVKEAKDMGGNVVKPNKVV